MKISFVISPILHSFDDVKVAVLRYELWMTLGWRDVLSRHRRSKLGVLWIPVGMAIVSGSMGFLYSTIMGRPPHEYIPYITTGFIIWNLLSGLVVEGTNVFVSNAGAIKEVPVPTTVYVFRVVWRNTIILLLNIIVYVFCICVFSVNPFPNVLLIFPALVVVIVNGLWLGLLFGIVNVRYRDFSQLVNSLMRLIFFLTPIIWYSELAKGARRIFVDLNPFYYFVELLRGPMLGNVPPLIVWVVTVSIGIVGWLSAIVLYAKFRNKINYWI